MNFRLVTRVPGRRTLLRAAVAAAVALGAPLALAGTADAAPSGNWDRIAQCESGGNWGTATGNGYYGGAGMPHTASKAEQIKVAERVLASQGWKAWPACSKKLGLR
jgi:resuscitation-promoting factor RpfA